MTTTKEQQGTQETNSEQLKHLAISNHDKNTFEAMIFEGLTQGGIQATANKGHGKSRLLFKVAEVLQAQEQTRVLIFDGSLAWLYGASKIPVFSISERDIISNNRSTTQDLEKYSLENWNLVKLCLDTQKDILFNLKTRKPSKRGFFIRTVISYLDFQQRAEKAKNASHDCTKCISYILEEAQDAFNSRSTAKNECEEFLTIFNEARNNKESFFSCSQRLTDMSKTIRAKQIQVLGCLSSEDITPALRRLEKEHKINFAEMPKMHWFYNGKVFESLPFKQQGKPYKINSEIKQAWLNSLPKEKPKATLTELIKNWFKPKVSSVPTENKQVSKSFFESKKAVDEESLSLEELEEKESTDSLSEEERDNLEEERDLREIEEEFI